MSKVITIITDTGLITATEETLEKIANAPEPLKDKQGRPITLFGKPVVYNDKPNEQSEYWHDLGGMNRGPEEERSHDR